MNDNNDQEERQARWLQRDNQRLKGENHMLRTEYARLNAKVAALELEILLERDRNAHNQAWLQRKVSRQKKELRGRQRTRTEAR